MQIITNSSETGKKHVLINALPIRVYTGSVFLVEQETVKSVAALVYAQREFYCVKEVIDCQRTQGTLPTIAVLENEIQFGFSAVPVSRACQNMIDRSHLFWPPVESASVHISSMFSSGPAKQGIREVIEGVIRAHKENNEITLLVLGIEHTFEQPYAIFTIRELKDLPLKFW